MARTIFVSVPVRLAQMTAAGLVLCLVACTGGGNRVVEESVSPAPSPGPVQAKAYPGTPSPGSVLWGAHLEGNGDPLAHEVPAGSTMGINRTFFQWDQRMGWAAEVSRSDVEAGRIPWISFKTPSWQRMADGEHDEEVDELLVELDSLGGPVWLTFHHEPEGGNGVNTPDDPSGPVAHLAMNGRIRSRMDELGTDNIALAPVLMAYSWTTASGRNPDDWWDSEIYDFLGVDDYVRSTDGELFNENFTRIRHWAGDRGVDVSVAEWAMPGNDEAAYNHFTRFYDAAIASATDGNGARIAAMAVFDSPWTDGEKLQGTQLDAFRDLMGRATSVTAH